MRQTLWDKLKEFPPIACRLLARVQTDTGGVRPMTVLEIAERAKMTPMEIQSLSWLTSWEGVPFGKVQPFSEACGVKLTDRAIFRTQCSYIRRGASFKYLKRSPDWETIFKPMIIAYVSTRRT